MREPLSPERWARVEAVFLEASGRPPKERQAYLTEACGDDDQLRAEVRSLLDADEGRIGERLDAVARVAEDLLTSTGTAVVGQCLGPYRLEEEIGRGGMGVVYRGVREGDDFQQTVAVKVLPGALFSPDTMDRFRNERRILAGLEHPNIARLLDGGATPEGVPYVIMEYVDGIPLDRYARERGLSVEDRIWLFLAVCDAVQYAHRNLVVHRDLKPSNILVTPEGTPKLLDFGIAKLVDPDEPTEADEVAPDVEGGAGTATVTRIMTPRFASPEQLLGKRIGTPSDVYSLGLVLYRLLAGTDARPAEGASTGGGRGTLLDQEPILRALEERIAPPSAVSGDSRLKGDLDTIVLEALRRDVSERYDSVRALADDLERYLTGMPIAARPPTLAYRARKFLRRNRSVVVGATVAIGLLVGQTGIFLDRLAEERDLARREADRATQTLGFLTEVFRGADPFVSAATDLTAIELLGQGTARLEDDLAGQPGVQAEILDAVGTVYENLGALDSARAAFERSLAVREATFGPGAPETAVGLSKLGGLLIHLDEHERADSLLSRSTSIRLASLPANHPDLAMDLSERAFLAQRTGRFQRSDSLYGRALAIMGSPSEPREPLRASLLYDRAGLLLDMDRTDEAEEALQEALTIRRNLHGDRHPQVAGVLSQLAHLRERQGRYEESESILRELLTWGPDLLGENHSLVTTWHNNLAVALKGQARYREALEIQLRVLDRWRALYGDRHSQVALSLNNVANLRAELGQLDEADEALTEALAINRSLYGDEHPEVATNLNNLATMAWRRQDHQRALEMAEEVLALDRRLLGPDHEYVATDLTAVGNYHLYLGRPDRAEPPLREGLELIRRIKGDDHVNTANAAAAYADWLVAVGREEEAEELARESLRIRLSSFSEDSHWIALSRSTLGAALTGLGRYEEAEAELDRARDVMAGALPEGDPTRVQNDERLRALYRAWGGEPGS